ncbi:MAG: cysteine desulfuration protein SufE [Lysobacterales bacterium]|jgi:cysteine desulfuration protein SufE
MSKKLTLDRLYKTFDLITDWQERYRFIIELGGKITPLEASEKTEANRIHGCMSVVHMVIGATDDTPPKVVFRADSDASIVNGLIGVLHAVYDDKTPEEIRDTDIKEIFSKLGLDSHLSPNRRNGFFSMVERLQSLANVSGN